MRNAARLLAILLTLAAAAPCEALVGGARFRDRISVSNVSGGTLVRVQVLVTLDTRALITQRMRSDCGDMRLVDSDGSTLLDYYLESGCDTAATRVWAKIPSLPAGGKTIYLDYGDAAATSLSVTVDSMFAHDATDTTASYDYYMQVSSSSLMEARVSATNIAVAGDDNCSSVQNLGFNALFYGFTVTTVTASTNGLAFLGQNCSTAFNNTLATFIAMRTVGFWDDLTTGVSGGVVTTPGIYFDVLSGKARLTWEATMLSASASSLKFQALFHDTGRVVFSMGDGSVLTGFTPTVGISKGDSQNYTDITSEIAFNKSWIFHLRKTASPPPTAKHRARDLSPLLPY